MPRVVGISNGNLSGTINRMLTNAPTLKRLLRPESPPAFRVTDRDVAIMLFVRRFRFATTDQIVRYIGESEQNVARRVRHLFFHGYLDRPNHQFLHQIGLPNGSQSLIYMLSRKGARVLAEREITAFHAGASSNATTMGFLAHTVDVTEVMLQFMLACRAEGMPSLLEQYDLLPYMPASTQAMARPFRCSLSIRMHDGRTRAVAVEPDRLFAPVQGNERRNFALEVDRGHMSVKSRYRAKLAAYFHGWRQERFRTQWGFERLRVLTVTTSETRIKNMLAMQSELTNDSLPGLFLYSTPELLRAHGPLGPAWISAQRDGISLIEQE